MRGLAASPEAALLAQCQVQNRCSICIFNKQNLGTPGGTSQYEPNLSWALVRSQGKPLSPPRCCPCSKGCYEHSRAPSRSSDGSSPPHPHLSSSASSNLKLLLSGTSLPLTPSPSTSGSQRPFPAPGWGLIPVSLRPPPLLVRTRASASQLGGFPGGPLYNSPPAPRRPSYLTTRQEGDAHTPGL